MTHSSSNTFPLSTLTLLISAALVAPSAMAEAEQEDGVVVWGAKVSSSSEFLSDEDISVRQADHMSDLLRDIPGVDVGGTHSVNQRIVIRGLHEKDLDIRLDGASQYAYMFHHVGNLTLNPDIIKAVDIQVGANSVTYGGVGGAVHFETKDAQDMLFGGERWGSRVFLGAGSNDFKQASLTSYGMLTDNIDAMLYLYQIERENFKDGAGVETAGAAGDLQNMLFKLGWEPNDYSRFQISYDTYSDEGDYSPRPDMNGEINGWMTQGILVPTTYDRETVTLSYKLDLGDKILLNASIYRNEMKLERDESVYTNVQAIGPDGKPAFRPIEDDKGNVIGQRPVYVWPGNRWSVNWAENRNLGGSVRAQSVLASGSLEHTFTYGLDYNEQRSRNSFGTRGVTEEAISTALYLEDKIRVGDRVTVTPGIRFENFDRKAKTGTTDYSGFTYGLAADVQVTDHWSSFISHRTLFNAPKLIESFIDYQETSRIAEGTKEEGGYNNQIGVRYKRTIEDQSLSFSFTAFETKIEDRISESWDNGGYLYKNGNDVEYTGFEAAFFYGYQDLNARVSYSQTDNKDVVSGLPVVKNRRSSDIGDTISVNLDYHWFDYGVTTGWGAQFVQEEDNVLPGNAPKPSYDVHNVYVQWMPTNADGLQLTFGIDNVFDESYTAHASRDGLARGRTSDDFEPGRNVKLSMAYQF
ncbi:TonB-dependent siderophore receptor [Thaumasiovibrio subtropicus]|uniref:TonB-dependent siderophore receptor n=1 Tax=Thaumasiovibrio subtropicus TaxID=1891207 RepID=UPI000B360B80|nr:TonB-dependent siderophore receptor [Thaumasiovibrio subtropicus]